MTLQLGEHFGMREPQGWVEFNEAATENLAQASVIDGLKPCWSSRIETLATNLETLSHNELEAYRYYAIGEATCDLAKILRNPEVQTEFITYRAANIATFHPQYAARLDYPPGDGLHLGELYQWTNKLKSPIAERLVRTIPENRLLVSDSLSAARKMRFNAMKTGSGPLPVVNFAPFSGDSVRQATSQLISGASDITRRGIRGLHLGEGPAEPYTLAEYDPLLREVIDPAKLREVDLVQIATQAAGLRQDEFERFDDFYDVLPDGTMYFDVLGVPRHAGPLPDPSENRHSFIHTDRIRCPALYVNKMIEMALCLVADSAKLAAERLDP